MRQKLSQACELNLEAINEKLSQVLRPRRRRILVALRAKKITQLTLNLGCYDQSLNVNIKPIDQYKFWRKSKPMQHYLP